MNKQHFKKISIFGVGLLGGSLGLALKKQKATQHITGIDINQDNLHKAKNWGAIDEATSDITAGCMDSDLVIICTPISQALSSLQKIADSIKDGAIVIDICSTKRAIIQSADVIFSGNKYFVGSHPMCGSEKSGAENIDADIYKGASVFVCKSEKTNLNKMTQIANFWKLFNTNIIITTPERHDSIVSFTSHLPQLAAVSIVDLLQGMNEDENFMKAVIGKGFKDMTRIAKSPYDMWQDIYFTNKDNITARLDEVINTLSSIKEKITNDDKDGLRKIFEPNMKLRKNLD